MTVVIISALAILIGVILVDLHYVYKVDSELLEIQLQLDKQEVKLNHAISQLEYLQIDNEVIDHNLHVIIGSISNLKEELKWQEKKE